MPRISAPSVAEHRANRLHALLEAAREVAAEQGAASLTLGAVARRVGLSRTALYEYFPSRDDLLAAMVEAEIPRWVDEVAAEVDRHDNLADQVTAYVREQLAMLVDGRHNVAVALSAHALGEGARERVREEHDRLLEPLARVLHTAGVAQPDTRAQLVQGIVNAALPLLRDDDVSTHEQVIAATVEQALHGLPVT